ncbi:unnamed protein product [Parascedosporium putredinis]|uniref:G-protein coupled receptors family 2 profile 2 domain-containing protein n=1 Tax=Parascedosporium putredinis TaxID=1442378 RepID=A0A9P1H3N8_9PEZI|nr:unnamed protein product [Parascedosporium putredinis]CAI7997407.1 unnamed protein product [Parascedosporium putredinis]
MEASHVMNVLRTVPNLFILFASIANAGASIACLIGYDGVRAGTDSALCKTQAFLLEMLMQSDPWWSFAMAVNVYLVFFYGANPASFRKYVWVYCLICFGIPFIPALVCLLYKEEHRGPVYGDATLWCWIGNEWTELRIYTYYLPIWVCIFFSTLIYFAVGYRVFKQRNQLRNLTFSAHDAADANDGKEASSASDVRESADKHKLAAANAYGTAVTEVKITTSAHPPLRLIRAGPRRRRRRRTLRPPLRNNLHRQPQPLAPNQPTSTSTRRPRYHHHHHHHRRRRLPDEEARRDTRLFSALGKFRARLRHLDPVKLAYLRTSFVFAISILITWAPSSVNRIHNLIHPFAPNYGLNVASAVVLPLQGLWNAIIYFSTSWRACREELARLCGAYAHSPCPCRRRPRPITTIIRPLPPPPLRAPLRSSPAGPGGPADCFTLTRRTTWPQTLVSSIVPGGRDIRDRVWEMARDTAGRRIGGAVRFTVGHGTVRREPGICRLESGRGYH